MPPDRRHPVLSCAHGPARRDTETPTRPARYYRQKAVEARRAAEGVTTQAVRAGPDSLARDFDRLGDAADGAAQTTDPVAAVIRLP